MIKKLLGRSSGDGSEDIPLLPCGLIVLALAAGVSALAGFGAGSILG